MQSTICLFPLLGGRSGPASFQGRLAAGLARRRISVTGDPNTAGLAAILVIGGSRMLAPIWRARRRGVRIVQRLNGMNWIHRQQRTGFRHFLRAEYGNYLLAFIRRWMAQAMVYQSHFSQNWWERAWGADRIPTRVIYNAVDLTEFTPHGVEHPPEDRWRVVVVEGNLGGGYDWGLQEAVGLANRLAGSDFGAARPVELVVAGSAAADVQKAWQTPSQVALHFTGWLPRHAIPALDRSAHFLYSADIHPACPNSVIEALACGLPVLAYDTGALSELVPPMAGRITPYGGNAWRLEPPDQDGLLRAASEILTNQQQLRVGARQQAEEAFDLEHMVDAYLEVLLGSG